MTDLNSLLNDEDEDEDLPFSIIGKAFGLASSIYSSIKTSEFRSKVLSDFTEIEKQLAALESLIESIAAEQKMIELILATDNAEAKINNWYYGNTGNGSVEAWLSQKDDSSCPASIKKDIDDNAILYLNSIHNAILGKLESNLKDWMSVYLGLLPEKWSTNDISMFETSYGYFIYLVNLQLKCFAAMAWADSPDADKTTVQNNIVVQGKYVAKVLEKPLHGFAPYTTLEFISCTSGGGSSGKYAVYNRPLVHIGGSTGIPQRSNEDLNYVIYDFNIKMDSNGVLIIHVLYGELDQDGYVVEKGEEAYCQGGDSSYMLNYENNGTDDGNGHKLVNFIITSQSSYPWEHVGYVLVDICFQIVDITNVGNTKNTLYALALECELAPTILNNDGIWCVDYDNAIKVKHQGGDVNSGFAHFFGISDTFDIWNHDYSTGAKIPAMTGASFTVNGNIIKNNALQSLHYASLSQQQT